MVVWLLTNVACLTQRDGPDMPVQMDAAFYSNAPVVEWHLTRNPDEFDLVTVGCFKWFGTRCIEVTYAPLVSPNIVASIGDSTSVDSHRGRIFQVCMYSVGVCIYE